MLKDKAFLLQLYNSKTKNECRKILMLASDAAIKTLVKVLHCNVKGRIPPMKTVRKAKKFSLLRKELGSKAKTILVLKACRTEQLEVVLQFNIIYHLLLDKLFNE
jgi:hypothetical protein